MDLLSKPLWHLKKMRFFNYFFFKEANGFYPFQREFHPKGFLCLYKNVCSLTLAIPIAEIKEGRLSDV